MPTYLEHLVGPQGMSAGFDRNETWRQAFKFTTESCDSRRQKAAGDDLRLIVQNAEVAPSVAKIDTDRQSSNDFPFSKIDQRSNICVLSHSPLSCSCTHCVHFDQAAYFNRRSPPFSSHLDRPSGRNRRMLGVGRAIEIRKKVFTEREVLNLGRHTLPCGWQSVLVF